MSAEMWCCRGPNSAAPSATDCSAQCVPVQSKAAEVQIEEEERVKAYQQLLQQAAEAAADMRAVVNTPQHLLPFLQPGRLVQLLQPGEVHGIACSMRHGAAGCCSSYNGHVHALQPCLSCVNPASCSACGSCT